MKPTQQQKDNKLIAEFMGLTIITDNISYFDTNYKALKNYHSDWNWLMEVIEKIETEFPNYTIQWEYDAREEFAEEGKYKAYLFTLFPRDEILTRLTDLRFKTRIEAVYNACVEFVKWYNENK